jgi:protein-L-isoaspartate(D-aspartate) O-methyltransferase
MNDGRERMVRQQIKARGITDPNVLEAMRSIPRHRFVPKKLRKRAYEDNALPIGAQQTISQPYMVAYMTSLLNLQPGDKVLEIGVGSGYQTAVLAHIAEGVLGIERIPELAERARRTLAELGITNVRIQVGDGTQGAPAYAPCDAILVAAAGPSVPRPLMEQLSPDGRLVVPVGPPGEQTLVRVTRRGEAFHVERLIPVRFVPLIGEHGTDETP